MLNLKVMCSLSLCVYRYGKIQSVKILPQKENERTTSATVAFMDIKSASKAHNTDNNIDAVRIITEYSEQQPASGSTVTITRSLEADPSSRVLFTQNLVKTQARFPNRGEG